MRTPLWRLAPPLSLLIVASFPPIATAQAVADGPPYRVTLASGPWIDVLNEPGSGNSLSFDLLSDMGKHVFNHPGERDVVAAGYAKGVRVHPKVNGPTAAAQAIVHQISDQTGLHLKCMIDSVSAGSSEATMLQAFSDTAVITVQLTPLGNEQYDVTCAYTIYARPPGSLDGSRAGAEKQRDSLAEMRRRMNEDSIADDLPPRISVAEADTDAFIRRYFRSGPFGDALLLMVKRGNQYSIGFYKKQDGTWIAIDGPLRFTDSKRPYFSNPPGQNQMALRIDKLAGPGSVYLSVANGQLIRSDL